MTGVLRPRYIYRKTQEYTMRKYARRKVHCGPAVVVLHYYYYYYYYLDVPFVFSSSYS